MFLRPRESLEGFTLRMASDSDVSMLCVTLMSDLRMPIKMEPQLGSAAYWSDSEEPLMQQVVANGWTNHSERATLSSMLAAIGIDKTRRAVLGRWSPSGSDDYVRTYKAIVKDLVNRFCRTVSSGRAYEAFDEEDAIADVKARLEMVVGEPGAGVGDAVWELERVAKEIAKACAAQVPEETPTEVASLSPRPDLEGDVDVEEGAKYIIVYTRDRSVARLHRMDGCWRARKMDFKQYDLVDVDPPPKETYTAVCKDCWLQAPTEPGGATTAASDDSESDSGSSESES